MTETTLRIEGMKCGGCVTSVEEALRSVPGVREVAVSLDAGRADVTVDDATPPGALAAAVIDAGFEATLIG